MSEIRLTEDISGSNKKYPYLARVSKAFPDFSTIVILVTDGKMTQVMGKYTGNEARLKERYIPGSVTIPGVNFAEDCLVPFNCER